MKERRIGGCRSVYRRLRSIMDCGRNAIESRQRGSPAVVLQENLNLAMGISASLACGDPIAAKNPMDFIHRVTSDANEIRTRDTTVKGWCLNRLTMAP